MNPKLTTTDAADCLGQSKGWVVQTLQERDLTFAKSGQEVYLGHLASRSLFSFPFKPQVMAFHIVKGGTGKTSLVYEFAIRASLYGARVLCIDLDQQGNLTEAFKAHERVQSMPVMIDVLSDGVAVSDCIMPILPGIDLIGSRFENALLDEVIRTHDFKLDKVYRAPLQALKAKYDLIVIDCPPSLGLSVAAAVLATDVLIAPVTPEKFALSGLELAYQSLEELEALYHLPINFKIVLNKMESRTTLSQVTLKFLLKHSKFAQFLLPHSVRFSQEFPNAIANRGSIFDAIRKTAAKSDIDALTQGLLGIDSMVKTRLAVSTELTHF